LAASTPEGPPLAAPCSRRSRRAAAIHGRARSRLMPKRTDIHSILLIGSGPIVIGQVCEFDYSGTQACRVLREEGYRVILANSNPATIMTDPEFADRTYIEPLTREYLTEILRIERELLGKKGFAILPTVGGQTALNLAVELSDGGVLDKFDVQLRSEERRVGK